MKFEFKYISYLVYLLVLMNIGVLAGPIYQQTIYRQGDNGYNTYRIPALIQAPDGSILAFAEGRKEGSGDEDNIDIVLRRSTDGGSTWLPVQIMWDDANNTCGNPTVLLDNEKSRLWLFMNHNLGEDRLMGFVTGTSKGRRTTWSCYSDDNGITWSKPIQHTNIKAPAEAEKNYWDAVGPGNGIQLIKGAHAGRLVVPANARNIYSDDHGETWHESPVFYQEGGNEGTVTEISGGALLRNDRCNEIYRKYFRRVYCYSYDQGQSWTPIQLHEQLITPICQASMIAYTLGDDKQVLLFSNPADLTRRNLTVKMSYNDGISWPISKTIYRSHSAYSSLTVLENNNVGLLYEHGTDWPYRNITFAKFNLEWIKDDATFQWDFENGSFDSNTVKDVKGYGLNGSCEKKFETVEGSNIDNNKTALYFDGSAKGIILKRKDAADYLDFYYENSFFIEVIFKMEAGINGRYALIANDYEQGKPSWWLRVEDGKLRFYMTDNRGYYSNLISNDAIDDGKWHKVSVIREAEKKKLFIYVDEKLSNDISDITKDSFVNDKDVTVGRFNNGSSAFKGYIDSIKIGLGVPNNIENQKAREGRDVVLINPIDK